MQTESHFRITSGPDGEWRLRRTNQRCAAKVYETTPASAPALQQEHDALQVSVYTLGEARPARLRRPSPATDKPISWLRKIVTARRLRKAESKPTAARGTT